MSTHAPQSDPSLAAGPTSTSDPAQEQRSVGIAFIVIYALAMFGFWMAVNLPSNVTLALRVADIDSVSKTTTYSLVTGAGILAALVAGPIFGQLSDHTRSRFGRRRPWILFGLVGTTIGAILIGLSSTVVLLVVGWVIMQLSVNAAMAAMLAIVSDRVPERQRGLMGALSAAAAATSLVAGIYIIEVFPSNVLAQFGLPVAVAILFGLALMMMFRDDQPYVGGPSYSVKAFFGSFYFNPRKTPDFAWLLGAIFAIYLGYGVITTYAVYYLQDRLGVDEATLTSVLFFAYLFTALATIVFAPLTGWITDRTGRRKPALVIASLLMTAGIALTLTAADVTQFVIGMTVSAGLGAAALSGAYIPMIIGTIKDKSTIARNLGFANIALALPFSVVPFAAPLLLGDPTNPNYVLLYAVGGVLCLVAIPMILRIRSVR